MMSHHDEQILVVPTERFHRLGHFQGFCADVDRYCAALLSPDGVECRPRSEMERDPSFKQLIPYMLFCWENPDTQEVSVFTYIRGKGMGESRLHRKGSVGVGGHINGSDLAAAQDAVTQNGARDFYREGLLRELAEEVIVDPANIRCERCVGLINDDTNEVGRVHLGIVHRFDLVRPELVPNEPDLIESGFRPVSGLLTSGIEWETWSAITLQALFCE